LNARERVAKILNFEEADRLPRNLWTLPAIPMFRQNELDEVNRMFEFDISSPDYTYGAGKRFAGAANQTGHYTDAWGSVWYAAESGVAGEVKRYPLADWSALDHYELPWELLDEADLSRVSESCKQSDKFILAGTETRPFERMQFLRGTENLFMDLASSEPEAYKLRDMLHEFFVREITMWAQTDVDGISFMDDWGTQRSLLISPELWRKFYKPLYKEYCDIIRGHHKYAFFHSDGNIEAIYPDLIEIGVNAVNSQLFCMDIERLGELYAGKIVFWGEIDRQRILPFGTARDVKNAVDRAAKALLRQGRTGVIAQCEWGKNDSIENIKAVFEQWNQY